MSKNIAITGNGAMAEAMRQINPDVVAAFPITPSTQVIEDFAKFVNDGKGALRIILRWRIKPEKIAFEDVSAIMDRCHGIKYFRISF